MSSRTLARWVSDKTDSLHSASTSNAFNGSFPLTEVAKAAGWTNVKTFGKCYNKPIIDNNLGNFLLTIAYMLIVMYGGMLRKDVCIIYVVLYIYQFRL